MTSLPFARFALLLLLVADWSVPAAKADNRTETFAVMRGGDQIGTNTISFQNNGRETDVRIVTHVEVKALFLTLYRFDQTETERWLDGRLLAMTADTDDNGTVYRTDANNSGEALLVHSAGRESRVAASTVPMSFWNATVLGQSEALSPRDGSLVSVRVSDRGEENVVVGGHAVRAHHYSVATTFSQDVWYDSDRRLVKLQLRASDGSTISYQLV